MTDERMKETAEADLVIARNGYQLWGVIDILGRYRENGSAPIPQVPASGFTTEDAAILARRHLVGCIVSRMSWDPTSTGEDLTDCMVEHFNRLGIFMSVLRVQGTSEAELEQEAERLRRTVFPDPGDVFLPDIPA